MEKITLNRRTLLISIILSVILVYVLLMPQNSGPFRAVPSSAVLVVEINGLLQAGKLVSGEQDGIAKGLLNSPALANCWRELAAIESLVHGAPQLRKALGFNQILAAYSLHPSDSLHPVYIVSVGSPVDLEKVLQENALKIKFFPYAFHGQTLYTVHLPAAGKMVIAQKGGQLICSSFSYLVEDAINELERPKGWWSSNRSIGGFSSEAPLKFFFCPGRWMDLNGTTVDTGLQSELKGLFSNLNWIGCAWDGQQFKMTGECARLLFGMREWNGALPADIFQVLPDNTASAVWFGFDNRKAFFEQYLKEKDIEFDHFMLPWIGNGMCQACTEPMSTSLSQDRLLLFNTFNGKKALALLEEYGKSRGMVIHDRSGVFDIIGFQSNSLIKSFVAEAANSFKNPFCAVIGDYVVFAPNRPALELLLEKYIANQTLAQNSDFLQLGEKMQSKDHILTVINGAYLPKLLEYAMPHATGDCKNTIAQFGKLGWIALEINPTGGKLANINAWRAAQTIQPAKTNVVWKLPFQAPVAGAVAIESMPGMDMNARVLAQDKLSELYCIKPDGSLDWHRRIGAPLLSTPGAIDYFHNDRVNYVFNTPDDLWLLDESGRNVPSFPVHFKVRATAGVAAVDFERNGRYSYFINTENGNVYGYDPDGRPIPGWNPLAETGISYCPMVHFQFGGKDYLVRQEAAGNLSVYDRSGNLRFPVVSMPGRFSTPPIIVRSGAQPEILCLNNAGKVFACDLQGHISTLAIPLTEGKPRDWAYLEQAGGGILSIIQGKTMISVSCDKSGFGKPVRHELPFETSHIRTCNNYFGIQDVRGRKIALIYSDGKMLPGFPLAGDTPFEMMEHENQQLLITGNGSAIFAYKLHE